MHVGDVVLGVAVERFGRWAVAAAVTLVSFVAVTWIGGVLLSGPVKDLAARWGLAGGAGVAVAALAALWGHGYATEKNPRPQAPDGGPIQATGTRSIAFRGNPGGNISTGDTRAPHTAPGPTPSTGKPTPPPAAPEPEPQPQPGAVTASGERSIAFQGDPGGSISTGDQQGQEQA